MPDNARPDQPNPAGQATANPTDQSSAAPNASGSATLKGCLLGSSIAGTYTLRDEQSGTVYSLAGSADSLRVLVGNEVKVTGQLSGSAASNSGTKATDTPPASGQPGSMSTSNANSANTFHVTNAAKVSDHCGNVGTNPGRLPSSNRAALNNNDTAEMAVVIAPIGTQTTGHAAPPARTIPPPSQNPGTPTTPGTTNPQNSGATPTPGTAAPTPGSAAPTPGTAAPTPSTAAPTPGTASPNPGPGTTPNTETQPNQSSPAPQTTNPPTKTNPAPQAPDQSSPNPETTNPPNATTNPLPRPPSNQR